MSLRSIKMFSKNQKKRNLFYSNSYILSIYCSDPQLEQKSASNDTFVPHCMYKCGLLP